MKGRRWLLIGVAAGIAIGLGRLPYLCGAATSLADTALRIVNTGGLTLIHSAARHGAPLRIVRGLSAVLAVLLPGVTALLLLFAARGTLRIRTVVGALLTILGIASFFYLPVGTAAGVAVLALVIAGIAVAASGPLIAAPLAGLGALIATAFLPRLIEDHSTLTGLPVTELHEALFSTSGSPLWLRFVVLVFAALPFVFAARLVVR